MQESIPFKHTQAFTLPPGGSTLSLSCLEAAQTHNAAVPCSINPSNLSDSLTAYITLKKIAVYRVILADVDGGDPVSTGNTMKQLLIVIQ